MYGEMFADMFWGFCQGDERKFQEAVSLVFDTVVADKEHANLGAKVCLKIKEKEEAEGSKFFKSLIRCFQKEFQKKAETRSVSIEAWLSIFSFMGEVYSTIFIKGQPIIVLGKAIYSTMNFLLELPDCDDDEVECICSVLKLCGAHLEVADATTMRTIVDTLRKKLISKRSTCRLRCVVLQVLELRAMGWNDPQKLLDEFYIDGLQDAIVEDEVGS